MHTGGPEPTAERPQVPGRAPWLCSASPAVRAGPARGLRGPATRRTCRRSPPALAGRLGGRPGEADPEPTHEATRRGSRRPLPPSRHPAARSAMGAAAVAAYSPRSSLASSSFSSSSGLQSGRAAPLTVSAPRPARPPAREGPPARPRRRTPGAQGGGLGPRRGGWSAWAGQGPAARGAVPPSCRAWRGEGSRRD